MFVKKSKNSESEQLRVGLDANGLERGYSAVTSATDLFCKKNSDVIVVLYGNVNKLKSLFDIIPPNVRFVSADNSISQSSSPLSIRHHPHSSLSSAVSDLRKHKIDCLVSGNNSGCLLAICSLMLNNKKVKANRPFFSATFPVDPLNNSQKFVMFADTGANLSLTGDYYLQMTRTCLKYYPRLITNQSIASLQSDPNLRVGLLNVGTEKSKGTDELMQAHKMISQAKDINFIGNIEPRDVFSDKVDIVIFNGLIGNIFCKTFEATFKFCISQFKQLFASKLFLVGLGLLAKKKFVAIRKHYYKSTFSYLLGLTRPVIKIHGSSNRTQINAALEKACFISISEEMYKQKEQQHADQDSSVQDHDTSGNVQLTRQHDCFTSETVLHKKVPELNFADDVNLDLSTAQKKTLTSVHKQTKELLKYLKIQPRDINLYVMALTHSS